MTDLTNILGGPWSPPEKTARIEPDAPEIQLADAMKAAGIDPPPDLRLDGQLHRFSTKGRKKDDSGWYVAFGDGVPAGSFGCWRDSISVNWQADVGRELTAAEKMAHTRRMAEARAARDAARQRKQESAAHTVEQIWEQGSVASPDHPYLAKKGIQPHGARVTGDGRLMVPLYDAEGQLSSLQYISADSGKKYHPGGATKERFWLIGDPDRTIFVAEGFATAATIHEVTGQAVAIAYTASNLPETTSIIRDRFGVTQEIVVVADNDASGIGQKYGDQASAKYGARMVMPPISGDANDYHMNGHDLAALLYPPRSDWLIHADEFCAEPAPLKWLVKHWLQEQATIMVFGPSGVGKSFIVLDWCQHIASGLQEWNGNKVKPGRVVYLAGEGHFGMRGRVAAWKQHHQQKSLDMYISSSGCDLNTPEGYQKTAEAIRSLDTPPAIIVVDTLHRFLHGDENSAQDAKTMIEACDGLRDEFGCSVLLVHHTGVSDEAQHRGRGSSAWKGSMDIEIAILKPSTEGGSICIRQSKAKDSEQAEDVYIDLQSVTIKGWFDEDGEAVTSAVVVDGVAPIKAKADSPTAKAQQIFERAWFDSQAELMDGAPYLTKSGFQAFLEKNDYSPATIRNYLKPSYASGPIGTLLPAGIIETAYHGWIVADQVWASALMMQREK